MLDGLELLVIPPPFFFGLVDRLVELVGAKAVGSKVCRSNWKGGMAMLIVAGYGGRPAPGCNGRLDGGLVLVVCRARSHRLVEKRGHPLNLASQASSYGLGLKLHNSQSSALARNTGLSF